MKKKLVNTVATFLFVCMVSIATIFVAPTHKTEAQQGWIGGAQVPGFFALATNSTSFSPAVTTGAAGTVTNPASNFLMQIDGGPIFCGGGQDAITESNITLAASTTFLIVYNCPQNTVYAKTAVTAPGNAAGAAGVGIPTSLLFAIPGVEVPLATVVCNATACGNGGNGSITDSRSAINFPNGTQLSKIAFASLNASAPDGAMVICTSCAVAVGGVSATCTSGAVNNLAVRKGGAWICY